MNYNPESNISFVNGMILVGFVSFIINIVIVINQFCNFQEISNDGIISYAEIVDIERNYFGEGTTYKFKFKYFYKNEVYYNFEQGGKLYSFDHYKIGEKTKIIISKTNPNLFIDVSGYNITPLLIVAIVSVLISFLFLKFKKNIVFFLDSIS